MPSFTRIFTIENGDAVIVRDNTGLSMTFESLTDLSRCTGMDFTSKYYMGYEPNIEFFEDSEDPNYTPEMIPYIPYENIIADVATLQVRKADITYGLTGEALLEAQAIVEEETAVTLFYTEITAPVEVTVVEGTFTFSGGAESASFINNAILLSDQLSESDTQLIDINSQVFTFGKQSAKNIAVAVGVAFRSSYFKLHAEKVRIKNK
jgi:hypothetical protein